MFVKNKLITTAFLVFGLVCGVFAFFTEISTKMLWFPSSFFLQMAMVSLLVAIYFQLAKKE